MGPLRNAADVVLKKAKPMNPDACARADAELAQDVPFLSTMSDNDDQAIRLDAEGLSHLDEVALRIATANKDCASVIRTPLMSALSEQFGRPESEVATSFSDEEKRLMDSAESTYAAILAVTSYRYEKMRAMDTKLVRFYSVEEQADDVGVNVSSEPASTLVV
jgi:hypothetical protein